MPDSTFEIVLSPAQLAARAQLETFLPLGNVFTLRGSEGVGHSTLLRSLHQAHGGQLLTMQDFLEALEVRHPAAIEETLGRVLLEALKRHDILWLDDLSLLHNVVAGCGNYPRSGMLEIPLNSAALYAVAAGKKFISSTRWSVPGALDDRSYPVTLGHFEAPDYEFFARRTLGHAVAGRLDFGRIHRYAAGLNAHPLLRACTVLRRESEFLNTDRFIEYLRSQFLTSNINLDEVQSVTLQDLKGIDDIVAALEAHVVLPLENDDLSTRYRLRPKRGVLLAGPPGTGKTTVGRALAHRLQGKFFRLDGTFIAGSDSFYHQVQHLFDSAMENPPSVLFIDDADVLFEHNAEPGLYRYLLTLLDGLESKTAGQVCVVMTAMDVAGLPPALVRSGRIELWLEMRLPDVAARTEILSNLLIGLPSPFDAVDLPPVVDASEGFTGADLKRMAEEAKVLYVDAERRDVPLEAITSYFLKAAENVRLNRQRYAAAGKRSES